MYCDLALSLRCGLYDVAAGFSSLRLRGLRGGRPQAPGPSGKAEEEAADATQRRKRVSAAACVGYAVRERAATAQPLAYRHGLSPVLFIALKPAAGVGASARLAPHALRPCARLRLPRGAAAAPDRGDRTGPVRR